MQTLSGECDTECKKPSNKCSWYNIYSPVSDAGKGVEVTGCDHCDDGTIEAMRKHGDIVKEKEKEKARLEARKMADMMRIQSVDFIRDGREAEDMSLAPSKKEFIEDFMTKCASKERFDQYAKVC